MVLTTTIVQSSCNLPLFPLHCGIWGNRLQEASFPAAWHNDGTGLAQLWYNDGTTLALRRVSRFLSGFGNKWPIDPRCHRLMSPGRRNFQASEPSFLFQALAPRIWWPPSRPRSKLWRLKSSEECLEPGFEISHGATLDYWPRRGNPALPSSGKTLTQT